MSLTTTLTSALSGLNASEGALQITNNNIANVNTPGYSREVVNLQSVEPAGQLNIGNGVQLAGYTSVRSEILLRQIQQQTQDQGAASAQLTTMQQVQPAFTTSTQDIGTQMSALFSSLSSLSNAPSSTSSRQAVLTAGQNLAEAFNTASTALTSQQSGLDTQVTQDVGEVNTLTQQIATLNPQIKTLQQSGEDAGVYQDQQNQLLQQLSQLTGFQTTQTDDGVTITTANGSPLVVGNQSYELQASGGPTGNTQVLDANGDNITSSLQGGDLGGTLQTRDQTISGLLNQLDTLAQQFGEAFNTAQSQGFTQNGAQGGDFFNVSTTTSVAAATLSLALTDPAQVAASSDGTAGSAGNLSNFSAIQNSALSSGSTPTDTYANIVYQVGSITSNANAESTATTTSLQQLNSQLGSVSGVSIDEETTNLLKYQQSYQAAAQVINTVNTLFTATMAMMSTS